MAVTLTTAPKTSTFQQAVNRLMAEIAIGEKSADESGWIDESEVLSEFGTGKKS